MGNKGSKSKKSKKEDAKKVSTELQSGSYFAEFLLRLMSLSPLQSAHKDTRPISDVSFVQIAVYISSNLLCIYRIHVLLSSADFSYCDTATDPHYRRAKM